MGQNHLLTSKYEAACVLLQRDYPKIYEFDGDSDLGATIVPVTFMPKKPNIVDIYKSEVFYTEYIQ